jgi:endonuclease YncB( thermonuclease family)
MLTVSRVSAAEMVPGPLPAELIRVIDGDTIEVRAHLWLGLELTTRVRLADIDAPELDGRCRMERDLAKAAREYLALQLPPTLALREVRQDKYGGRVVARVSNISGEDLGRLLVANGLATPARAGTSWCQ